MDGDLLQGESIEQSRGDLSSQNINCGGSSGASCDSTTDKWLLTPSMNMPQPQFQMETESHKNGYTFKSSEKFSGSKNFTGASLWHIYMSLMTIPRHINFPRAFSHRDVVGLIEKIERQKEHKVWKVITDPRVVVRNEKGQKLRKSSRTTPNTTPAAYDGGVDTTYDEEPASAAAINGGELMTGGIQPYDGGVGLGNGIGNGFAAHDQEPSSAANGGELMTGGIQHYDGGVGLGNGIGNGFAAHDQEPSSVANSGEPVTGGIQHYDGGVGRGDWIGNGFGANYQELSSSAINGELITGHVRANDQYDFYFRDVRRENGEVHFHMNPTVNVDGRVYNFMQGSPSSNPGSNQRINKIMLGITGQTSFILMGIAVDKRSSSFPLIFYFVLVANAIGFIATIISMLLRNKNSWAAGNLAKVGTVASSSATILAMGMILNMRYIWAFVFLCIITAAAVLFGQT